MTPSPFSMFYFVLERTHTFICDGAWDDSKRLIFVKKKFKKSSTCASVWVKNGLTLIPHLVHSTAHNTALHGDTKRSDNTASPRESIGF